ncbi:hypothetical protein L1987_01450 [Smallanthus sonchifolius]|uniref:Uncharacterized protein n=1 Tax=Smallanthus sonchifolius TaxID=185202 RepID=A0ACB9K533_9ASTR|nr:hypothetical protein L1987_01450 [Smallanthus sonchifolius]
MLDVRSKEVSERCRTVTSVRVRWNSEDVRVVSKSSVGDQVHGGVNVSSEESMDSIPVEQVDQDEGDLLEVKNKKLLWRVKVNENKINSVELEIKELKDSMSCGNELASILWRMT